MVGSCTKGIRHVEGFLPLTASSCKPGVLWRERIVLSWSCVITVTFKRKVTLKERMNRKEGSFSSCKLGDKHSEKEGLTGKIYWKGRGCVGK